MVWRLLLAGLVATVLSVTSGLFLVGCGSTGVAASGQVRGIKFEIVVNDQGEKVAQLSGSLPPGICLKVTFIGGDGKVISTATTGVPGYLPVPAGTVGHAYELVDCRTLTGAPVAMGHQVAPFLWHELMYVPVEPDFDVFNPFSNTMAAVRMKLPAGVEATDSLLALIEAGPGTPIGVDFEVDCFNQMVPGGNGARLLVSDNEPIVDFDLAWNGVEGYATLDSGNVTQYSAGNGWSVVQTKIPLADFAFGQPAWNGGTTTVLSAGAQAPAIANLHVQAFTN